jgi:polyisoprenoid-binding protein YceI
MIVSPEMGDFMKVSRVALAVSTLVLCLGLSTFARAGGEAGGGGHHELDPDHSWAVFKVNHFNLATAFGRFEAISGSFDLDEQAPEKCRVEITLQTESVSTGVPKRDQHLRSRDFFDAKQFPTITFKSTKVSKSGPSEFEVTGDLTLHGVTKPLTVKVAKTGEGDWPKPGNHRVGFQTTFTVKRTDFGMKFLADPGQVGDEVEFTFSGEGVRK